MADAQPTAPAAPEPAAPSTTTDTTQSAVTPATSSTSPSPGEKPAPSPSAKPEKGEARESLLQAVQKAVKDREPRTSQPKADQTGGVSPAPAAQADTTAPATEAAKAAQASQDDLPDEVTAEELAAYHPSAKRRVDKLIEQRRELRSKVDTAAKQLAEANARIPQAEAAASVQKYLKDNDIGRDDFLLLLELGAAMRRGDFRTFYEGVKPYVSLAEEYLGVTLPQDLQQRVREGHMSNDAARLYARERMDRSLAENARMRTAQQYDQSQIANAQQNLSNSVRDTVNAWEAATMQSDPDYAAKKPLLQEVMWSVVRERGAPSSPDAAVEIAKEAYRRVNEHSARWAPPKRPTSRQPSSTGRTNGAAPEAKTLKDAVAQAIERTRASA
jgi:hypothetical protein